MDYKEEFEVLVQNRKYEDARILLEKYHIHALEDPFYYANMGWILNQLERYDEAILYLKKGLALFPGDGWMYSQIAYAYDRQNHLEEGMKAIDEAFSLGFDEPWLHGEKGWCYKEMREYQKAINCFEDALMDDEDNVWLLAQAAYTYLELEEYKTAEEYFLKCYRLQPNDDSLFDLVNYYKQVHDFERVLAILDHEVEEQYLSWKYFELGNASVECKRYEAAINYLLDALALGRDDTGIRTLLADAYLQLNEMDKATIEYDKALVYYEKALLKDEHADREWIWQEMIWLAHKEKDYDKKLMYLDRASAEFPDNRWMLYHYARCYSDRLDYENGTLACEKCISLGDDSKEMLDLYAWNLGRHHEEEKAIDILKKRMQRYGTEEWTYGELGWNYAQQEAYELALDSFTKAADTNPKSALHVSMMGWCNLRLKEYSKALQQLCKAIELGRKDGWVYAVLGEVYVQLQESKKAIECYEYALAHEYEEAWIREELAILKEQTQD